MLYERSLEIERRLDAVLSMVRKGTYSTPQIAAELGVSIPTVSRDVTALRQRGQDIRAERGPKGWRYVLRESKRKHTRRKNVSADGKSPGARGS